jgi:hypothetical protein
MTEKFAKDLQPGDRFQVRYQNRWSNNFTASSIVGNEAPFDFMRHVQITTTTGKTKLLAKDAVVRSVAA